MKKYGNRKRNYRKGKKQRRAARSKPAKSFAERVKAVIAADVETKVVVFNSSPTAFNQQINAAGDCLRLMPAILNGTAENQKIGNVIKLQSLNIRGVLTFALGQTTAANTRIGVRMMILKAKRYNDWNAGALDFGTAGYTKLLEGTNLGFQGTVAQFNTPANRDYFSVVMDKRFYMSQSFSAATTNTAEVWNTTKFVNFKVPYCKNRKVIYDQDYSVDEPTNFPYFLVLGYTKLDGSAADLPATAYLTFQYSATAHYEDA